jgi:hypothetical protein
MTLEAIRELSLKVIREWRNPLMAIAVPMGTTLRQKQNGMIVLALPHWIADSFIVDALADSVKMVSKLQVVVVPGTMFKPAQDKPGIFRRIKNYVMERPIVAVISYPLYTVIDPTPDKARGFAVESDYVVHTYANVGDSVTMYVVKAHPLSRGLPEKPINVNQTALSEDTHINWDARERGAEMMTRTI